MIDEFDVMNLFLGFDELMDSVDSSQMRRDTEFFLDLSDHCILDGLTNFQTSTWQTTSFQLWREMHGQEFVLMQNNSSTVHSVLHVVQLVKKGYIDLPHKFYEKLLATMILWCSFAFHRLLQHTYPAMIL